MLPAMKSTTIALPVVPFFSLTTEQIHDHAWKQWKEVLDRLPACDPVQGPWIAGGSVRRFLLGDNFCAKDIDYFCASKQQFNMVCAKLETSMDAALLQETVDHRTYTVFLSEDAEDDEGLTIQVIKKRFCPTLVDHLKQFDFTICQTGWDGKEFCLSIRAYHHLSEMRLSLTGTIQSASASWMRVLKYTQQGFIVTTDTLETLIEHVGKDGDDGEGEY